MSGSYISGMFETTSIPVLEQVVYFTKARHEVLAGNVANMDTPGYKVRDLSPEAFHEKLKEAIEARQEEPNTPVSPLASDWREESAIHKVRDSLKGILFHDQSNDSIEQQVAEISKNQGDHNTAIDLLRHQFRLLEAAISEQA